MSALNENAAFGKLQAYFDAHKDSLNLRNLFQNAERFQQFR
jgi:hypothetical protein